MVERARRGERKGERGDGTGNRARNGCCYGDDLKALVREAIREKRERHIDNLDP